MIKVLKIIKILLECIRCFPHLIIYYTHKNRAIIKADIHRWQQIERINLKQPIGFIYLLSFFREFRNLFYNRIGCYKYLLNIFCPGMSTLIIKTHNIGEGLFIQHGFTTIINAKSIGINCFINQQVTIDDNPTILNNVKIYSGAIIIGNVTIGNNSVIGANTTVFHDVPDNCIVFTPSPQVINVTISCTESNTFKKG